MLLIALHFMETTANYNDTISSLYLYDREMCSINVSKYHICNTNSSVRSVKMIEYDIHLQLPISYDSVSVEDGFLVVVGKCYSCELIYPRG